MRDGRTVVLFIVRSFIAFGGERSARTRAKTRSRSLERGGRLLRLCSFAPVTGLDRLIGGQGSMPVRARCERCCVVACT